MLGRSLEEPIKNACQGWVPSWTISQYWTMSCRLMLIKVSICIPWKYFITFHLYMKVGVQVLWWILEDHLTHRENIYGEVEFHTGPWFSWCSWTKNRKRIIYDRRINITPSIYFKAIVPCNMYWRICFLIYCMFSWLQFCVRRNDSFIKDNLVHFFIS